MRWKLPNFDHQRQVPDSQEIDVRGVRSFRYRGSDVEKCLARANRRARADPFSTPRKHQFKRIEPCVWSDKDLAISFAARSIAP